MHEQEAEVVGAAIEAFNRHDDQNLAQLLDDDFEFVSVLTCEEGGGATCRGPEAWTEYFAPMDETWDDWRMDDAEFTDEGGQFAAVFHLIGNEKASGLPAARTVCVTYRLLRGKLWRMRSYPRPFEILTILGLFAQR